MSGKFVNIEDTIKGFNMILDGDLDYLPENAFSYVGTIEEAIEKGEKELAAAKYRAMKLDLITPTSTLFAGDVTLVQLPGLDGLFEILPSHAPLVSALKEGRVKVEDGQNEPQYFDIHGGVVEVSHDKVFVMAE